MSTEVAIVDQLKAAQEALASNNLRNAQLAAGTVSLLIEAAGTQALLSQDPAEMAKVINALQPIAVHPEKQAAAKQTVQAASALLQIILDDTPQVAPPKRPKPAVIDVEDAQEVRPAAPAHAGQADDDLPWGDA